MIVTAMTTVANMIAKRKELDNTQVWKIFNKIKERQYNPYIAYLYVWWNTIVENSFTNFKGS